MLKGYGEYKETNYDWLPQIPAHWKWIYLSQSCKEQCVKNSEDKENTVLSLSYGNIIVKKDINFGLVPKAYSDYQIVDKGNIILRLTDLQNDHTSLRTGLVKERGIITSAYTCLKPYENPNYLQYLLHSYDTLKVFYGMGGGVRQSIGFKEIRNMNIPLPPRSEQDQIVRYLDWKVSLINKYINTKKRQIELLKERKQAIINQAITKGLDSKVSMKNSDIEWLREIPAHWEVNKLRYFCQLQNGISESGTFFLTGTPFVSYSDVYRNYQLPSKVEGVAAANKKQQEVYSVRRGDIFFTRTSETIDEIAYSSVCFNDIDKAVFSGFLIRVRQRVKKIDLHFAKYFFRSLLLRNYFCKEMNLVTRVSLGQTLLKDLPVILPPMEEQKRIGKYLEYTNGKIDSLIEKYEDEIIKATEYRTRLISDVVTGKVNVQNVRVSEFEKNECQQRFDSDEKVE